VTQVQSSVPQSTTDINAVKFNFITLVSIANWVKIILLQCSDGCAGGFKTRDVFCFKPSTREKVDDKMCGSQRKPDNTELCYYTCKFCIPVNLTLIFIFILLQ